MWLGQGRVVVWKTVCDAELLDGGACLVDDALAQTAKQVSAPNPTPIPILITRPKIAASTPRSGTRRSKKPMHVSGEGARLPGE